MRIRKVRLKSFKRFDDLTIDLGEEPAKVVALVGPNGCGKSSVFDAFEDKMKSFKRGGVDEGAEFYSKQMYTPDRTARSTTYTRGQGVEIEREDGSGNLDKKSVYIRSAYRFTPKLNLTSITAQTDIIDDAKRPGSSIAVDQRLQENHERMLGVMFQEFEGGARTGDDVRKELVGRLNEILQSVLQLEVASLGNVTQGRGQIYFDKSDAKDFPYQNLSAGEKEVVDIIVDLVVKTQAFDDTVYCIDEPELHLNTAIQRRLLVEVEKLIPDGCQLWVATHSAGFLRALQQDLAGRCCVLDFSERDYFSGSHVIRPMELTRRNWQRIFATALDDLAGLLAPRQIIYCEGRKEPSAEGAEQGFDARVYNRVFEPHFPETLFVSSGGNKEVVRNSGLALDVLKKAFLGVELLLLRDRDEMTDAEMEVFVAEARHHRVLARREIENYLFDAEVLRRFAAAAGATFNGELYNELVKDPLLQDLKEIGPRLLEVVQYRGSVVDFKNALAEHIAEDTRVYGELRDRIFGCTPA